MTSDPKTPIFGRVGCRLLRATRGMSTREAWDLRSARHVNREWTIMLRQVHLPLGRQ